METEEIKEFRKSLKLTQRGLAEKLGVTSQTVANWEQQLAKPSLLAQRQIERLRRKSYYGSLKEVSHQCINISKGGKDIRLHCGLHKCNNGSYPGGKRLAGRVTGQTLPTGNRRTKS